MAGNGADEQFDVNMNNEQVPYAENKKLQIEARAPRKEGIQAPSRENDGANRNLIPNYDEDSSRSLQMRTTNSLEHIMAYTTVVKVNDLVPDEIRFKSFELALLSKLEEKLSKIAATTWVNIYNQYELKIQMEDNQLNHLMPSSSTSCKRFQDRLGRALDLDQRPSRGRYQPYSSSERPGARSEKDKMVEISNHLTG
ncbi:hypothetical protein HAX54_000479 [Datura stramonium]|uniref:Uncharacterized protein n=1 Tax=Datura stramonium TaxID=4076 RepID=A0ABS8T228_DATST|nr:hypothetical protein [Datura stramonium]